MLSHPVHILLIHTSHGTSFKHHLRQKSNHTHFICFRPGCSSIFTFCTLPISPTLPSTLPFYPPTITGHRLPAIQRSDTFDATQLMSHTHHVHPAILASMVREPNTDVGSASSTAYLYPIYLGTYIYITHHVRLYYLISHSIMPGNPSNLSFQSFHSHPTIHP